MDGGVFGMPFGILLDGLKDPDIPDAGHPGFHNGACLVHPQGCGLEPGEDGELPDPPADADPDSDPRFADPNA